ncbi:MAG: co-chaperone GroES [Patescibacteria group bacterium]|nr:co-chaperone GroES [Patescibacteria group bacterium]MDE1988755.1 co-chaperone GroES [Patescibacteria group bacterium]MDE2218264.1 co-chaperone GroES [Patescibacteria group bacterium]
MKKQNSNLSENANKIIPLGDRVLLKVSEDKNGSKTASGIFIPDTVDKEKPEQGKVVAVGEGKYIDGKLIPINVKVGDTVVFSKYGYDEIKVNDEEFLIVKEDNILAIIK